MKSLPWGNAGNANMRGRKTLYAGDCDYFSDLRPAYFAKLAKREMREGNRD
jgi:hypothetical protein